MGSSFSNVHIRTGDQNAVKSAFNDLSLLPVFISRAANGWVSTYPHITEGQDEEVLKRTCSQLSAKLKSAVLGVILHDSDILIYSLAEDGQVVDHYNSWPGYFDGSGAGPTGGITAKLLPYCIGGTDKEALDAVLRSGGKGLPGAISDQFSIGAVKKQAVKASPWWAKPAVWGALSLIEMKSKSAKAGQGGLRTTTDGGGSQSAGASEAAPPTLNPEMTDAIWRGARLADALAKLLGIDWDRMSSCYGHIQDGSAALSRRSLVHVGDEAREDGYAPTAEQQAQAGSMIKEMICPLSERPSYLQFLAVVRQLLDAPAAQEGFKKVCADNGLTFKQGSINMMGLGASPLWWTFTFEADQMPRRKFGLTALPRDSTVQCANCELCKVLPSEDGGDQLTFDSEYDFAEAGARQVLGQPAMQGRDAANHKYAAWRGANAFLFIYQSPSSEMEPYKSIELWWEPWTEQAQPSFAGVLAQWLHGRHPDLF